MGRGRDVRVTGRATALPPAVAMSDFMAMDCVRAKVDEAATLPTVLCAAAAMPPATGPAAPKPSRLATLAARAGAVQTGPPEL